MAMTPPDALQRLIDKKVRDIGACGIDSYELAEFAKAAHALGVSAGKAEPEQLLLKLRDALKELNIDGCNVWNNWMDDNGTLHREIDAAIRSQPAEGEGEVEMPNQCIIGEYCSRHGFIHGAEAEELRERFEGLRDKQRNEAFRSSSDQFNSRRRRCP